MLAPLFAQVEHVIADAEYAAERQSGDTASMLALRRVGHAKDALSAIERHVQDMGEFVRNQELAAERAMRRASGEGYTYEQGRRDAFFEVRDRTERAALLAREKEEE